MSSNLPVEASVPPGFPAVIKGPAVWTSSDPGTEHIVQLSPTDIAALDKAPLYFSSQRNFVLPADLAVKLKSLSKVVYKGRGFAILRGLDPSKYTEEETITLYGGLCSYVSKERADMLRIYNRAEKDHTATRDARFAPNETNVAMNFHTDVDAGDILSLFTLSLPQSGGQQWLASFPTVYNELARNDPAVLHALAAPWRYEMPSITGPCVIIRPVIAFHKANLQINFATAFLVGSEYLPRLEPSLKLTPAQSHAIDMLLRTCRKHALPISQQAGDVLFANNLSVLHARSAFIDNPNTGQVRHILSMMLRDPDVAWQKPADVAERIDERFARSNLSEFFMSMRLDENLPGHTEKSPPVKPPPQRHD